GEQKAWLNAISGNTVESYKERIQETARLLNSKLGSYQKQWSRAMPSGAIPDLPILDPDSARVLQKIQGGASFPAQPGQRTAPSTFRARGSDGNWYYTDQSGKQNYGLAPAPPGGR